MHIKTNYNKDVFTESITSNLTLITHEFAVHHIYYVHQWSNILSMVGELTILGIGIGVKKWYCSGLVCSTSYLLHLWSNTEIYWCFSTFFLPTHSWEYKPMLAWQM